MIMIDLKKERTHFKVEGSLSIVVIMERGLQAEDKEFKELIVD